jgi:uncharacterized protein YndB with AHSA1/START domain
MTQTEETADRDLVLARMIDAPPAKVFRAWTDPALLVQWFAPLPWTTPKAELDVRPGGSNMVVMRGPDGTEFPNRGVYLEVVENQRLVFTDAFVAAWEPSSKPFMTVILTFEDVGGEDVGGKTRYTALVRHWSWPTGKRTRKWGSTKGGDAVPISSRPWSRGSSSVRRNTRRDQCPPGACWMMLPPPVTRFSAPPPCDPAAGVVATCCWAIGPDPLADCCCTTLPLPTVTASGPWLLITIGRLPWW